MKDLDAKIQQVAKAGVTWLTALLVFVTTVTPTLPEDWQTVAANVAAGLVTAITIIRRHSPVKPSARGILPVIHKRGI